MDKQGSGERHSPEVRARAVRMVLEHAGEYGSQWGAISSIAGKIGCSAETLRRWVRQAERDEGSRPGPTSADRTRIRKLERERSEEHTSELQSLMRISYAVFCLKKKNHNTQITHVDTPNE